MLALHWCVILHGCYQHRILRNGGLHGRQLPSAETPGALAADCSCGANTTTSSSSRRNSAGCCQRRVLSAELLLPLLLA